MQIQIFQQPNIPFFLNCYLLCDLHKCDLFFFFWFLIRSGMYSVLNTVACTEIKAIIRIFGLHSLFIHTAISLNRTVYIN